MVGTSRCQKARAHPLHAQYIAASRQAATNRQRRLLAGVSVALVVSIALAILSLFFFGEVIINVALADSKAGTATVAQGQALEQAEIAANNAATATVAQGQAQQQATAVSKNRYLSEYCLSGQAQVELDGYVRNVLSSSPLMPSKLSYVASRACIGRSCRKAPRKKHVLKGHTDIVTSVDWSPEPNASSAPVMMARPYWDVAGNQLALLDSQIGAVTRALWSPDATHSCHPSRRFNNYLVSRRQ